MSNDTCSSRHLVAVDGLFCLPKNDERYVYMRSYTFADSSPARIKLVIELE